MRKACPREGGDRASCRRVGEIFARDFAHPTIPAMLGSASIEGAPSWPMDSSALAPLLLLGKPELAIGLRKKYFFSTSEEWFPRRAGDIAQRAVGTARRSSSAP